MKEGYIYMIVNIETARRGSKPVIRVGKTKNSNYSRPKTQISYLPFQAEFFGFKVNDFANVETEIHRLLKPYNKNADWYYYHPNDFIDLMCDKFDPMEFNFPSIRNIITKQGKCL